MFAHTLLTSSTIQIPIALASDEADLYGVVRGACKLLGFRALARDIGYTFDWRRANAAPMSHGLSVLVWIDSGSAVTDGPRILCPNIPLRETNQLRFQTEGRTRPWSTVARRMCCSLTAGHKRKGFNFQVCNVRFPIVSVYRLAQAACKLEVHDSMAHLRLLEKGTLDLELIGAFDHLFAVQTR